MGNFSYFKRIGNKIISDLKRKRTIEGLFDYGLIGFGHEKKDCLVRVTDNALIEHRIVTVRYLALIDGLIILGAAIGLLGNPIGWTIAIFFFVMAFVVFVRAHTIEKHLRAVHLTIKRPLKKTIRKIKQVPKVLKKKGIAVIDR